jgi:hypothetical protein
MKVFGSVSDLLVALEGGDSRREAIFVSSAIKWVKYRRVGRDVRFGSKADICGASTHVRFTPESDLGCVLSDVR